MTKEVIFGILIPFIGTTLGAGCVFVLRHALQDFVQRALTGFAAGVMVAASIWSLIIPAMEQVSSFDRWQIGIVVTGVWLGACFLLFLDHVVPHLHQKSEEAEGPCNHLKRSTLLMLAVTLHNIPEGMAVGAIFAGLLMDNAEITLASATALSLGIAIQNFPEGAILSLPLHAEGVSKKKAFYAGMLSGVVEPVAAIVTILASYVLVPVLPLLLSFAAGAMLYVVVEELIPEASEGSHSNIGTVGAAIGFALMMVLDGIFG